MIERKRRVEDLLESMGRMVVPVEDESEAEREQIIEAVNARLDLARKSARARGQKRWAVLATAAMLCLSAGFAFAHYRGASRRVEVASVPASLNVFKRGDAIQTDAKQTRSGTLEDGAELKLAENTEFTVSALTPGTDEIVLDRGRVDLTVPKLHSGHTLSVTTPDSTVTVRGTRFSVEVVIDGSRATTNVAVTQGSVWVRQGDARLVLEAGSHWSSRPSAPVPSAPATAIADHSVPVAPALEASATAPAATQSAHPTEAAVKPAPSASAAAPKAEASSPPAAESSTLAQENDLYAAASRAAREGNDTLAVSDLNALLSRFPNSPLAQNARVDRFRALTRSGRSSEAVAAARRYLADYPNGFARDEAKALVLQSLASP